MEMFLPTKHNRRGTMDAAYLGNAQQRFIGFFEGICLTEMLSAAILLNYPYQNVMDPDCNPESVRAILRTFRIHDSILYRKTQETRRREKEPSFDIYKYDSVVIGSQIRYRPADCFIRIRIELYV